MDNIKINPASLVQEHQNLIVQYQNAINELNILKAQKELKFSIPDLNMEILKLVKEIEKFKKSNRSKTYNIRKLQSEVRNNLNFITKYEKEISDLKLQLQKVQDSEVDLSDLING